MKEGRLTVKFVEAVKQPGRYGDGGRGSFGLSLLVRADKRGTVKKYWQRRYLKDGKYSSRGLGVFPDVTLDEARDSAARFVLGATVEQLEQRNAPVRHVVEASAVFPPATIAVTVNREYRVPTFRRVFLDSLDYRKGDFKESSKTEGQAKGLFDSHIPSPIADLPIDEVTSAHLVDCAGAVWRNKPATAKKMAQVMKATFNRAIAKNLIEASPWERAKIGLGKVKDTGKHFAALPHTAVGAAIATIQATDAWPSTKLALEFLTLTAARSGEVRGAEWSEIDWDTATWEIPAARMKASRSHRVALSNAALDVLLRAQELSDGTGLVFLSERGKALSDSTLSKLLRENNIACVPHGMRTSFRTWAAECSDVPREIAEYALGHVEGSASELAYRRTDYFEKRRQLMEDWAAYVMS